MEDSGTESDDETDKEEGDDIESEEGDMSKLVHCYLIPTSSVPSLLTVHVLNDRLLFT